MVALIQFLLELIVTQIQPPPAFACKFRLLWARLSYLHNKHLKSPVKKLSSIVLGNYREVLALSLKGKITVEGYVEFLLEYAFALLFYYKYSQSEEVIRHCAVMLKMKMEFTGKLGRRTKYQVFDTPLLVMDLVSQN